MIDWRQLLVAVNMYCINSSATLYYWIIDEWSECWILVWNGKVVSVLYLNEKQELRKINLLFPLGTLQVHTLNLICDTLFRALPPHTCATLLQFSNLCSIDSWLSCFSTWDGPGSVSPIRKTGLRIIFQLSSWVTTLRRGVRGRIPNLI